MYKGNWWELYDKISNSESYSPHRTELALIDKNRERLQYHIKKYLTDIGCGNWEKAIHILNWHNSVDKISYIASDYSSSMIDLAEKNILEEIPNIKLWNHQIMRPWNELFTNKLDDNTYLRVGCTIWNFSSREKIIEQLKNMNNSGMLKGNKIIFSYFDSPNSEEEIKEIKKIYDNKEWHDFIMNAVQNLWLNPSDFDVFVDYDKKENCAYIWIKPKKDIHIKLDSKTISIKEGESYPLEKSKRFSKSEIEEILKESWAKIEDHISENWISIVVAKKDPKYYHKTMKIMWLTWLLLLWTLAWWIGWYQISQHKQKKEKQKIENKISFKELNQTDIRYYWVHNEEVLKPWSNIEIKQKALNDRADFMFNCFYDIYWVSEDSDLKEPILSLMKDKLLRKEYESVWKDWERIKKTNMEKFRHLPIDYSIMEFYDFIIESFVPDNKMTLNNMWIYPVPYNRFLPYKSDFRKTLNTKWELEINLYPLNHSSKSNNTWLKLEKDVFSFWYVNYSSKYKIQKIRTYYDYKNYDYYHFIKVKVENWEEIILAHKWISPTTDYDKDLIYSLKDAKEWIEKIMQYRQKYWE